MHLPLRILRRGGNLSAGGGSSCLLADVPCCHCNTRSLTGALRRRTGARIGQPTAAQQGQGALSLVPRWVRRKAQGRCTSSLQSQCSQKALTTSANKAAA
jgi:hypothetical protein